MMGADIHIYPEYWSTNDPDLRFATSLCGEYDIGRCYTLFSIMAGVRGSWDDCLVDPRGLPDDPRPGFNADRACALRIVEDDAIPKFYEEATITRSQLSQYPRTMQIIPHKPLLSFPIGEYIINPDYHTHSWLTLNELFEVRKEFIKHELYEYRSYDLKKSDIKAYEQILKTVKDPVTLFNHNFGPFEYASLNGLIGMLFAIERTNPNLKTRIVFWFDS